MDIKEPPSFTTSTFGSIVGTDPIYALQQGGSIIPFTRKPKGLIVLSNHHMSD